MRDLRAKAGTDKADPWRHSTSEGPTWAHHGGDDRELHPQTDRQKVTPLSELRSNI